MSKQLFLKSLQAEVGRIDSAKVSKRNERLIEGFTTDAAPKAIIGGQEISIFNSNDYLGLRHNPQLKHAEHQATDKLGTGPGAVRFISGSFKVHRDLEKALAKFHGRDDAMVFSSAFATNLAVIFSLVKGQNADSLVNSDTLVISDELNHRSIIDGIRLANLDKEHKLIFKHMNMDSLREVLKSNVGKVTRVVVITDGVFSMLGEYQDLKQMNQVIAEFDDQYPQGILTIVDDCHGVAAFGETGRGTEEVVDAQADVLVGTLGKGFGTDGGYVVASQTIIDYLRESAATYIYSNSISPGNAAASLASVKLVDSADGKKLLASQRKLMEYFKKEMNKAGFSLAAESIHPIQPILIGDPAKTKAFTLGMYEQGYLVTSINYPVVPKGRDEIRVQLNAAQTTDDLKAFIQAATKVAKDIGVL